MKVIQLPFCFNPDPVGGTEVYVEGLARQLQRSNINSIIAAPGGRIQEYDHDGLRVRRFAVSDTINDVRNMYGEGDACAAKGFAAMLDEEKPDVVHLHAFTRGVSLRLVREATRRGIPTVFTYHTPTVSCQRGTLLRWGEELCNGELDIQTCTRCTLHSLGMSRMLSAIVEGVPAAGRLARAAGLSGGLWTALRMSELVGLRQAVFSALMSEVDYVVALCGWVKDLLHRNGIPDEKIVVSRHGLPQVLFNDSERAIADLNPVIEGRESNPKLKIAFLGRFDATKGPDILLHALRLIPEASVELHLYGIVQDSAADTYLQHLNTLATEDTRIIFKPPVASNEVGQLLKNYDILAVPSQLLETGPLVVLEAFAAGVPVLGSNLGGIAELVRHEIDGLLVDPTSIEAWASAIRRCAADRSLLKSLRQGIQSPRTMEAVAQEMAHLYERVLHEKSFL